MITNIIIAVLIVAQITTCVIAYRLYRDLVIDNEDVSERIYFVLEALDDLRDYLRSHSYETDEKLQELEDVVSEETVDLDDPDWWKRG